MNEDAPEIQSEEVVGDDAAPAIPVRDLLTGFDEWLERSVVQPEPAFVMPPAPIRPGSFKALLREREAKGGGR